MQAEQKLPRGGEFAGRRVTVIGLGVEGQDLVRFFATRGARVTVSDAKPAASLRRQLESIADLDVHLSLGANRESAVNRADLVAISQGAPLELPPIVRARARGIPLTSRTQLFFALCPGRVVAISGSSGKTTTTSLVGAIFRASGRPSLVGGNIGGPLLSRLEEIDSETWVVLEVSHSQLVLAEPSPYIACLTNVTPNHLDRFSWDEYVGLKWKLLAYQSADDIAVLNFDNEITRRFADMASSQIIGFSLQPEIRGEGTLLRDQRIIWRHADREEEIIAAAEIPLRGRHNVENVLGATAVASAAGISAEAMRDAIRLFQAVPHRLELVAELSGVAYYNDSIATAPERTLAGIRSFEEPLVLLLGGRDKHLDFEELATEAAHRCRAVICFGEAGDLVAASCRAAHVHGTCAPLIRRVGTLSDAIDLAMRVAQAGDVVLLSPACTSFDAFDNFEERGAAFRAAVRAHLGPSSSSIASGDGRVRRSLLD